MESCTLAPSVFAQSASSVSPHSTPSAALGESGYRYQQEDGKCLNKLYQTLRHMFVMNYLQIITGSFKVTNKIYLNPARELG
jgi:hypothetical protein